MQVLDDIGPLQEACRSRLANKFNVIVVVVIVVVANSWPRLAHGLDVGNFVWVCLRAKCFASV